MEDVEIRRSTRRKRTLSAYREDGRTVVLVPAHLSAAEEARQVKALVEKLERKMARSTVSDDDLMHRAEQLSRTYLQGRARPTSVQWVTNQNRRWGSCTSATGTIRISHRVATMPSYVVDAVLLHELAHLIESNHGPRFRALVEVYPHHVKAEGFLEGAAWQQ